jgi:hypothetical protein
MIQTAGALLEQRRDHHHTVFFCQLLEGDGTGSARDGLSEAEMRKGGGRLITWLGIGACIFLAFAALMVFFGIRKQRRDAAIAKTSDGPNNA